MNHRERDGEGEPERRQDPLVEEDDARAQRDPRPDVRVRHDERLLDDAHRENTPRTSEREARATTDGDDRARGKLASEREGAGGERTIHARTGGYGGRCCSTRDDEISGLMSGEFDRRSAARGSARARVSTSPFAVGASQRGAHGLRAAAIRATARTPSISFPVRRMPDGTRVSDLPVGASRCAALPARAPRSPSPSRNDRLGLRLTPPPPSFPARSRSSHSRGVRVPTERRRRGFGRGSRRSRSRCPARDLRPSPSPDRDPLGGP